MYGEEAQDKKKEKKGKAEERGSEKKKREEIKSGENRTEYGRFGFQSPFIGLFLEKIHSHRNQKLKTRKT